jgi:hypothetical protein
MVEKDKVGAVRSEFQHHLDTLTGMPAPPRPVLSVRKEMGEKGGHTYSGFLPKILMNASSTLASSS